MRQVTSQHPFASCRGFVASAERIVRSGRMVVLGAALIAGAALTGPVRAQSGQVVLENLSISRGADRPTVTIPRIELTGTNLTQDEAARLFGGGLPSAEAAALARRTKAVSLRIPELTLANKDGRVVVRDIAASDVDAGKVARFTIAAVEGGISSANGLIQIKSGALALTGLELPGLLDALANGSSDFGSVILTGFELASLELGIPDAQVPATAAGGNTTAIRLGPVLGTTFYSGAIPLRSTLDIRGVSVVLPPASAQARTLVDIGFDRLEGSLSFSALYDPAQRSIEIQDYTVDGAGAGAASLKLRLGGLAPEVFSGASAERLAALIQGSVVDASLRIRNGGLFEKLSAITARQQGKTPDAIRQEWSALATLVIPAMLGGDPAATAIADGISRFIANPTAITLAIKGKSAPVPVAALAGVSDPSGFLALFDVAVTTDAAALQPGGPGQPGRVSPPAAGAPGTAPLALAPQGAAPRRLTGLAAWNALVGNTITGKNDDDVEIVELFRRDGTSRLLIGNKIQTGKWAVKGQKVCFEYPTDDEETCYGLEVSGAIATFTEDDGSGRRYTILPGNPKAL